jgi:signal peptidase I
MKKFGSKLYKFFKILLLFAFIAILIKAFAFDAFRIPSASMENTLLPGDFILASKLAYNISTPRDIPIIDFPIPYINLFKTGQPEVNDVVIFQFPRGFERDPIRSESKYIKRIVAGPHDTLKITKGEIFINNKKLNLPQTFQKPEEVNRGGWVTEENLYPPGEKWNRSNYGPIVVPAKGDTIHINPENFERWQSVIVMDYGERALIKEGTIITLDGKPISDYVLTQNCYFVLGDNSQVSMDSRHFGFITDNMIIGKALIIYWSYDSQKTAPGHLGFLSAIRTNRLFKVIK